MKKLVFGLLASFSVAGLAWAETNILALATNAPAAPSVPPATPPESPEAVERQYQALLDADDEAQAEVDKWIRDNNDFSVKGAGLSNREMNRRILARFAPVRKGYEDFLQRHPEHARARVAYGGFLNDLHEEEGAQEQWEKALALAPKDPAIYNNLANIYGHIGPVKKAFEFYAKAIELNPLEPTYYQNFATTVFLFRKDAMEFYHVEEAQVFAKAFELYSNAMKLDPHNFPLASDVAQTYYGLTPIPTEPALKAWTNALSLAHDEVEREGIYIHLARVKILARQFDEARGHLSAVTNDMYLQLKQRLLRNLNEREHPSADTNAPAPSPSSPGKG